MRATWDVAPGHGLAFWMTNGWNAVVDGPPGLAPMAQWTSRLRAGLDTSLLLALSQERGLDAPEGRPWRSLLDGHVTWRPDRWWKWIAHANVGSEAGSAGWVQWQAAAVTTVASVNDRLDFAVRLDGFREERLGIGGRVPGAIFWPVPWVRSLTATATWKPHRDWQWRLEARHDEAADALFPGCRGQASPVQDTLTVGMVQGF